MIVHEDSSLLSFVTLSILLRLLCLLGNKVEYAVLIQRTFTIIIVNLDINTKPHQRNMKENEI